MELDQLKNIWKNTTGFQPKNEAELSSMLKGNSQSIIAKIKRNVWFELILTIATGLGLLIYALMLPSGALKWTCVSMLILFVIYPFFFH